MKHFILFLFNYFIFAEFLTRNHQILIESLTGKGNECKVTIEKLEIIQQISERRTIDGLLNNGDVNQIVAMYFADKVDRSDILEINDDTPTDSTLEDVFGKDKIAKVLNRQKMSDNKKTQNDEKKIENDSIQKSETEQVATNETASIVTNTTDEMVNITVGNISSGIEGKEELNIEQQDNMRLQGVMNGMGIGGNNVQNVADGGQNIAQAAPNADGGQNIVQAAPNADVGAGVANAAEGAANAAQNAAPNAGNGFFNYLNGFNIPGLGMIRDFYYQRVLPPTMQKKNKYEPEVIDDENNKEDEANIIIEITEQTAYSNVSNSGELFISLAVIYEFGSSDYGVKKNLTKAYEYFEQAGIRGESLGIQKMNLHLLGSREEQIKFLKTCIEVSKSDQCRHLLGQIYLDKDYSKHSVNKAVEQFVIAADNGYEDSIQELMQIHLFNKEWLNLRTAEIYIDLLLKKSVAKPINNEIVKLIYAIWDVTGSTEVFRKLLKYVVQTKNDSDLDKWYKLGYRKYLLGDIDRALLVFSFASFLNHDESTKAAAYIWDKNLTKNLTCRLGHHKLWAAYFYLRQSSLNNKEVINFSKIMYDLAEEGQLKNVVPKSLYEVAYDGYQSIVDQSVHARFNLAHMKYNGKGVAKNTAEALEDFDYIINKGWNSNKYEDLLPCYLSKIYYNVLQTYDSIIAYFD